MFDKIKVEYTCKCGNKQTFEEDGEVIRTIGSPMTFNLLRHGFVERICEKCGLDLDRECS